MFCTLGKIVTAFSGLSNTLTENLFDTTALWYRWWKYICGMCRFSFYRWGDRTKKRLSKPTKLVGLWVDQWWFPIVISQLSETDVWKRPLIILVGSREMKSFKLRNVCWEATLAFEVKQGSETMISAIRLHSSEENEASNFKTGPGCQGLLSNGKWQMWGRKSAVMGQ